MENIIDVKNLKKHFKDVKAVDGISFSVETGQLLAFLGVNGAGKSTTINILCSILKKDEGEVFIDGLSLDKNIEDIKKKIGIVFQSSVLDKKLTVVDNLKSRAAFYGITGADAKQKIEELSIVLDLKELLNRTYGKLSGGQRRRVDIARALIQNPKILFLDEPTTGLDPASRIKVWEVLNELRAKSNLTIFLTTHYMEETSTADKVIILDAGKIVASDTPNNLKKQFTGDYIKLYMEKNDEIEEKFEKSKIEFTYKNNSYFISFKNSVELKNFIIKFKDEITDFEAIKGDMDDVFLNVTGKQLREK